MSQTKIKEISNEKRTLTCTCGHCKARLRRRRRALRRRRMGTSTPALTHMSGVNI